MPDAQHDLFGDLPRPADAMVKVAGSRQVLGKVQLRFNKLIDDIRSERAALAHWQAVIDGLRKRAATELEPLAVELRDAQVELAMALDAVSVDPTAKLSRRRRDALDEAVVDLLEAAFQVDAERGRAPEAALVQVFDRHSALSHAEDREFELALAREMFGDFLGKDGADGPQDLDAMLREAAAGMADRQRRADEEATARRDARAEKRRATGKGPTKAEQAEAAREAAASAAGQTVREVYRKLASSLHPDKADDEAGRARRTELMKRANQAYEGNDLLALLSLQVEIEQIDADGVAALPDERVAHFNHVLSEQLRSLRDEVIALRMSFTPMQPGWARAPTERELQDGLARDIQVTRDAIGAAHADRQRVADPRDRLRLFDEWAAHDAGMSDRSDLEALLGWAGGGMPEMPAPKRQPGTSGKRGKPGKPGKPAKRAKKSAR